MAIQLNTSPIRYRLLSKNSRVGYEKNTWIQVDPTWTSTTGGIDYFNKLDNNHLVFSIKGLSSEKPHPAGSYKAADQKEKDVEVSFSQDFKIPSPSVTTVLESKRIVSGFPNNTSLKLFNPSGVSLLNLKVSLITPQTEILPTPTKNLDVLPPFSEITLDFKLREKDLLADREDNIKIKLEGFVGLDKFEKEDNTTLLVKPFYIYASLPVLLITVPLSLLLIILLLIKFHLAKIKFPKNLTPPKPI